MTDHLDQLNAEIKQARKDLFRQKNILNRLQSIKSKLGYKDRDLKRLNRILHKEEQDVLALEKMSIRSLFVKYLGKLEDRLEVERQEYLHAYLQYDSCLKSIEALHFEQEILQKVNSELHVTEKVLQDLLKRKKYILRNGNHKETRLLIQCEHKIAAHEARNRDIQEAISVGNKVIIKLIKLVAQFENIKAWGAFEYYGKGRHSSSKKKQYLRNAKESLVQTKILLDKFETELHHVSRQYKLDYEMFVVAFDDFIKIFYDALITDWVIQKKIKNASNALGNFKDKSERIIHMLKHEIELTDGFILEEQKEIQRILIGNQ